MTWDKLLPCSEPQILTYKLGIIHKVGMGIKCDNVLGTIPGTWGVFSTC